MARWQLRQAHYLNVPGTEWEYKETDQQTGKQGRKVFAVPCWLDEGTNVCQGKGERGDVVFTGPPTPDMDPLDDEAEAISNEHRHLWIHPIESLAGQGYSQSILADLERKIDSLAKVAPVSASDARFEAMQKQIAELQAQLAERPARRA